jgi:hypothetical protein
MVAALRRVRRHISITRLWTCYAGRAGTRIRSEVLHQRSPSDVLMRIKRERVPTGTIAGASVAGMQRVCGTGLQYLGLTPINYLLGGCGRIFWRSESCFLYQMPPPFINMSGNLFLAHCISPRKTLHDRLSIQPSPISLVLGDLARYKSFIRRLVLCHSPEPRPP